MKLKWLYIRNFRKINELSLEFCPHSNEIIGKNGQGKTTLLEAIHLCMTGSSFRSSIPQDLIRHDEIGFFIECGFEKQGVHHELQISFDGRKKRIFLDKRLLESSSTLLGQIVGITCTPELQQLLKGAPQIRRHFLDLQLAQVDPLYVHHLSRYVRALKQRNHLLRTKELKTIEPWENELAKSGSYIVQERYTLIRELEPSVKRLYTEFTGQESSLFSMSYQSKIPLDIEKKEFEQFFLAEFERKRLQELQYGSTIVGPHRDDLTITVNDRIARDFASEGEVRLFALILKLAERERLGVRTEESPLTLIDDFSAYLDQERQERLFKKLSTFGQVFITSLHSICNDETMNLKTFEIDNGMCASILQAQSGHTG